LFEVNISIAPAFIKPAQNDLKLNGVIIQVGKKFHIPVIFL